MANRNEVRQNIQQNKINSQDVKLNTNNNVNKEDEKILFNYQLNNLEISDEDMKFILNLIANSKIDGSKIHQVFDLTLKLQYKLKITEENNKRVECQSGTK